MKKESLKRQAMITACCGALVRAMGFGLRLWISRLLGAEALGVTELASGAHMLALTPAAAGLPSAVSRLTAKAENTEQRQMPCLFLLLFCCFCYMGTLSHNRARVYAALVHLHQEISFPGPQ
jgi:stage V sporulation protein B